MNTAESKLLYLLHILSHRNYVTVNMEHELGWTDSRTLKFIEMTSLVIGSSRRLLPVCSATTLIFMSHVMIQSLVTSFR